MHCTTMNFTLLSCDHLSFVLNIFAHSQTNLPHSNAMTTNGLICPMLIYLLFKQMYVHCTTMNFMLLSSDHLSFVLNIFAHSQNNLPHSNTMTTSGLICPMLIYLISLFHHSHFCQLKQAGFVTSCFGNRRHILYLSRDLNIQVI